MGKALLGIGFSMGAEDAGFGSFLGKMESGVDKLTKSFGLLRAKAVDTMFDSVEKGFWGTIGAVKKLPSVMKAGIGALPSLLGKATGGLVGLIGGFGKMMLGPGMGMLFDLPGAIAGLVPSFDSVGKAIGRMSGGINLTSELEAEAVGTGKSVREMGAAFGYSGKELDKFTQKGTGMSMALNIGADESAKALRGWMEAEDELKALGFKSRQEFAKFTAAFGTDADLMRDSVLQMRNEFDLTDEQISNVTGSLFKMGQETGAVPEAMQSLPELLGRMREEASLMGVSLDPQKLTNFATGTSALATGLFQIGQTAADAREGASELATALVAAERQFDGMFAGVQQEMPQFVKELAITTGDVDKAFKLMESGPDGFVMGMADMVAEAKKNGTLTDRNLKFVGHRLEQMLGDKASARLINFFKKADAQTIKTMANTKDAVAEFGKAANETFRTGRTMQDVLDRAQSAMFDRFRALGKPAARKWLKDIQVGFGKFTKQVAKLGKNKGPLGQFARKMAEASVIGAQAFVPKALQPVSMVMSTIMDKMGPTIGALSDLGLNFTSLSGIIASAAAGLALFATDVALNKGEMESWADAIDKTAEAWAVGFVDAIETAGSFIEEIAKWLDSVDMNKLFDFDEGRVDSGIGNALYQVRTAFEKFDWGGNLQTIMSKLVEGASAAFTGLMNNPTFIATMSWLSDTLVATVKGVFTKIPWGLMWDAAVAGLTLAFEKVSLSDLLFGSDEEQLTEAKKTVNAFNKAMESDKTGSLADHLAEANAGFQSMPKAADEAMSSVMSTADQHFGNSVNTIVADDMAKTTAAFEMMAMDANAIMDTLYANIEAGLNNTLDGIVERSHEIVNALATVASIQESLVTMGKEEAGRVSPAVDRKRDAKISQLASDEAIHTPLWYAGSTGYERLFTAKMNQLITAIHGMQVERTAPARQAADRSSVGGGAQSTNRGRQAPTRGLG